MAYKLFKNRDLKYSNGENYFSNYFDSYWDMYVLVTTANNPDVMMPAYDYNTWFALFFVIYEIINLYIFMNVVLAVIYSNYKDHIKKGVRETVYMHRRLLSKAFEVLMVLENGCWVVTWDRWHQLITALFPNMNQTKIDLMLYVLDDNHNDVIEKGEFLQLRDLLSIELVDIEQRPTFLEKHFQSVYNSTASQKIRHSVLSKYFTYVFDILIVVNALCIALDFDNVEWFFLSIFTVEILVTVYSYGVRKCFARRFNVFDCLVIIAAWSVTLGQKLFSDELTKTRVLDLLLILRIVRVVRLGESFKGFRIVMTTIMKIVPFIFTYGSVLVLFYYIFACIGMEMFKGRLSYYGYDNLTEATIYCGNVRLNGSEFYIKRYCKNNFNNIIYTFVVLYDLMVVNQWHELSNGFILTSNKLFRIYFFGFHIICVIVLLNIFAAFILEIFLLEYSLSKDKVETAIEMKIRELEKGQQLSKTARLLTKCVSANAVTCAHCGMWNPLETDDQFLSEVAGLQFKLKKKSSMRVESILQQMFESEIEPTDDGENTETVPQYLQPRRLTLSML